MLCLQHVVAVVAVVLQSHVFFFFSPLGCSVTWCFCVKDLARVWGADFTLVLAVVWELVSINGWLRFSFVVACGDAVRSLTKRWLF